MDQDYLIKLLDLLRQQNGGVVLQQDGTSKAVLLSIDRYYQLLAQESAVGGLPAKPNETVLVTGGAGYIGAHVVRKLKAAGYNVIVVDNLSTGRKDHVPEGVKFYQGSVEDRVFMLPILEKYSIDAIIHLAASPDAAESVIKPLKYFDNNVISTEKLLRLASERKISKFIFSSTAAVYGTPNRVPTPESAPIDPVSPYGASKYLAEQAVRFYSSAFGVESTVLRYFNACGVALNSGLHDTHPNGNLITIILEAAYGKRDCFVVNGNDYDTFDGTCVRDLIHVEDVAEAHILALQKNPKGEKFRVYNVGTGKGYSVEQVVTAAAEILNRMIPMEIGPRRAGDPVVSTADCTKIKTELGFVPQHSSLENIFLTSKQLIS